MTVQLAPSEKLLKRHCDAPADKWVPGTITDYLNQMHYGSGMNLEQLERDFENLRKGEILSPSRFWDFRIQVEA